MSDEVSPPADAVIVEGAMTPIVNVSPDTTNPPPTASAKTTEMILDDEVSSVGGASTSSAALGLLYAEDEIGAKNNKRVPRLANREDSVSMSSLPGYEMSNFNTSASTPPGQGHSYQDQYLKSGAINPDNSSTLLYSDDADLNLPPGRMNAVKGHHRLHGSGSNFQHLLAHHRNNSFSGASGGGETPRSRSISPSMKDKFGGGYTTATAATTTNNNIINPNNADGNSSISSFDEVGTTGGGSTSTATTAHNHTFTENDILTDRAGFCDELVIDTMKRLHNSREFLNLPPTVNERMTDDALEDSQAFADCQVRTRSSNASLVSGVSSVANEPVLEPLDECEEGLEDSDDENNSGSDNANDEQGEGYDNDGTGVGGSHNQKRQNHTTIILTNMENLNLYQQRILEGDNEDYHDNNNMDGDDEDEDGPYQRRQRPAGIQSGEESTTQGVLGGDESALGDESSLL